MQNYLTKYFSNARNWYDDQIIYSENHSKENSISSIKTLNIEEAHSVDLVDENELADFIKFDSEGCSQQQSYEKLLDRKIPFNITNNQPNLLSPNNQIHLISTNILSSLSTKLNKIDTSKTEFSDKNISDFEDKSEKIEILENSKTIQKIQKMKLGRKDKFSRLSERLKNITKNYAKKCIRFALTKSNDILLEKKLTPMEILRFKQFLRSKASKTTSIAKFRELLLILNDDNREICQFKQLFQRISEIFISYYALNWIFNSVKIKEKKGHVFARFKMLRRVQNPEFFTSIH